MKKTFITSIPDEPGSFLKPTKIISDLGLNITRVSYNNSIDSNSLFIDVNGDESKINEAYELLNKDGLLFKQDNSNVLLMEFKLLDEPNSLVPILELISEFNFNISYISSQENSTNYQDFKMALFIDNPTKIDEFLKEATKHCTVKIINYDKTEKNLDNTVFYISFADELAGKLDLDEDSVYGLIENSNLLMQLLDEKDENPHKTFNYIARFGGLISKYRGFNFKPRIGSKDYGDYVIYSIEPPCGSNIYIIKRNETLVFIDSGFRTYIKEMKSLLEVLIPGFENYKKYSIITHPDIDHCGMMEIFEKVFVSQSAYENFKFENEGKLNFREQYQNHEPYVKMSKILSSYIPPKMEQLEVIDNGNDGLLECIGQTEIEGLTFKLYNGNGGHSTGEVVITLDDIIFSGDILVNPKGYTDEQREFNGLAPYLMTSVNMNSKLAKEERMELTKYIENKDVLVGHGLPKW